MANHTRSLNAHLAWEAVLLYLGLPAPVPRQLPYRCGCPLCETGRLRVVDDHVLGGAWTDCPKCRFAGDLVELTAAVLKCDPVGALTALQTAGLLDVELTEETVETYLEQHVHYRQRMTIFWERASDCAFRGESSHGMELLDALCLRRRVSRYNWEETMGRIVGIASPGDAEELFAPLSYRPDLRLNSNGQRTLRRGGGPGSRRIFRGKGWQDVVVIPYYDLPGRLCGFLFVARNPQTTKPELIYRRANYGAGRTPREAGIGWLPTLDEPSTSSVSGAILVLPDPITGLILQSGHVRNGAPLMPIVIPFFGVETQTRQVPLLTGERRVICIGSDPRLWRLARHHDGYIWPEPPENLGSSPSVTEYCSDTQFSRATFKARPWRSVVLNHLNPDDPQGMRHVVETLELSSAELDHLTTYAPHDLRNKLLLTVGDVGGLRVAQVRGRRIEESPAGWRVAGTEELLCNFCIRITEADHLTDGTTAYHLSVQAAGITKRTVVLSSDVERDGLLRCVTNAKTHPQLPPLWCQQTWNREALAIALQLFTPQIRTGTERVGWNADRRCFVFPQFSLTRLGEFLPDPMPIQGPEPIPAQHLRRPDTLGMEFGHLFRDHVAQLDVAVAVLTHVATNLLAGPWRADPLGLILDGPAAEEMGTAIATAYGCATLDLQRSRSRVPHLERIEQVTGQHNWPLLVRLPPKLRRDPPSHWLDHSALQRTILPLAPVAAVVAGSHSRFLRLHVPGPPVEPGAVAAGAARAARPLPGGRLPAEAGDQPHRRSAVRTRSFRHLHVARPAFVGQADPCKCEPIPAVRCRGPMDAVLVDTAAAAGGGRSHLGRCRQTTQKKPGTRRLRLPAATRGRGHRGACRSPAEGTPASTTSRSLAGTGPGSTRSAGRRTVERRHDLRDRFDVVRRTAGLAVARTG